MPMDTGDSSNVFVIEDFKGFFEGSTCEAGGVVDRGEYHTPIRSRGFRIDNDGKILKESGFAVVGQMLDMFAGVPEDFPDLVGSVYGIHHWSRGGAGSTLIAPCATGIYRSRSESVTPGTTPYLLRFDALTAEGPTWGDRPSTLPVANAAPPNTYADFAEFDDRLYIATGIDWPMRIPGIHSLFSNVTGPKYHAMGVYHPTLASTISIGKSQYNGQRADSGSVNATHESTYLATVVSPYGESPPAILNYHGAGTSGTANYGKYVTLGVSAWNSNFAKYFTGINIYRVPAGGTIGQYVTTLNRSTVNITGFLDSVTDGELGAGVPYDVGLPSNFRLLCTHHNRMFGVGGYGGPNQVACSKAGYPDVFPPLFILNSGKGLGSELITRMFVISGTLYFFLESSIIALVGTSPENYQFRTVNDYVGCVAPRTLFPFEDGVIFLSKDGLYFFNGTALRRLSESLVGLFSTASVGTTAWRMRTCGAISKDFYKLSYRDDTGQKWQDASNEPDEGLQNNRTYVVNVRTGRVGVYDDWAFNLSTPYGSTESIVVGHRVKEAP